MRIQHNPNAAASQYPQSTSFRTALLTLYAIQEWTRLPLAKDGTPYKPGFFTNKATTVREAIKRETRGALLRLIQYPTCISCQAPRSTKGTGDHLVASSKGGSNSAINYLPLCKRCNSSKGSKDLMEWWAAKGHTLNELEPDAICVYARLIYQRSQEEELDNPAPPYLIFLLNNFLTTLPTRRHVIALMEAYNDESNRT